MELKTCDLCDKPFVADEDWKTLCILCWKEEKGYNLGKADEAFRFMRQEFVDLQTALDATTKAKDHYRKKLKKHLKEKKKEQEPWLTQKELLQLIRLAHPDRHNNSPQATELTKKLLALRGKHEKK